jgi:tetratricopeptide (TPR) repeat protein
MNFTTVPHHRRILFLAGQIFSALVCTFAQLFMASPTFAQANVGTGGCSLKFMASSRDYRPEKYVFETTYKTHGTLLKLVEDAHFTPNVELLRSSKSGTGLPGPDLAYTLRVYPNHHRALLAMAALGEKKQTSQPEGSENTVECWYIRALTFAPDDNIARMLFAQFLIKKNRNEEADKQLDFVASHAGDNAFTHNNVGLLYFDMKNYDKALFHSHKAIELGLGTPVLPGQLKGVGKWVEPSEVAPVAPAENPK